MKLTDLLNATAVPFTAAVIASAIEADRKLKSERLGVECLSVLQQSGNVINTLVSQVREVRRREKALMEKLEKVNKAVEYFQATGNPYPYFAAADSQHEARGFARNLGLECPVEADFVIPADWKPPVAE